MKIMFLYSKIFYSSTWTSFSEENLSFEYANKALSDLGVSARRYVRCFGVYAVLTLVLLELALITTRIIFRLPIADLYHVYDVFNVIEHRAAGSCDRSGFFWLRWNLYNRKKPLYYFIGCLFATGIHSTAFITLSFSTPERCGQYKVQIPVQQCRKSYYRPLPTTVYIADRTASVLCVARETFWQLRPGRSQYYRILHP